MKNISRDMIKKDKIKKAYQIKTEQKREALKVILASIFTIFRVKIEKNG